MSDYNAMSLDELMTFAKELERDNRHVQASRARIAANNRRAARDAVLDLAELLDAEGMVVVPRMATIAMLAAGDDAYEAFRMSLFDAPVGEWITWRSSPSMWEAFLAAAPLPASPSSVEG